MDFDVLITTDSELMVAYVEAQTDEGVDLVDSWMPARPGAEYQVVDSGRLILEQEDTGDLVDACRAKAVTIGAAL